MNVISGALLYIRAFHAISRDGIPIAFRKPEGEQRKLCKNMYVTIAIYNLCIAN